MPAFLLHDLGNAVSVVATVAATLDALRDDLGDAELTAITESLTRQSAIMARLVSDLADHARITAEGLPLNMGPVRLAAAVRGAVGHLEIGDHVARVNVPDHLEVVADADRLQQVIGNLVANAQVHGGPSLWIDAVARGDRVVLSVSDDGPGLEPALLEHAFEPFQRGQDAAGRRGAGLGLAMSRRLVRALGGELHYRRHPGGAQFVVELRTADAPTGAAPLEPIPPPFDHAAVIYVEDAELTTEVATMIAEGLATDDGVLVVATPEHEQDVRRRLEDLDLVGAERDGRLLFLDALTTLRTFDDGTTIDPGAFEREVGGVIAELERRHGHVRVFGEMVALQWEAGDTLGALELEVLWGELYGRRDFALLCGYPAPACGADDPEFRPVHDLHGHLFAAAAPSV